MTTPFSTSFTEHVIVLYLGSENITKLQNYIIFVYIYITPNRKQNLCKLNNYFLKSSRAHVLNILY